MCKEKKKRIWGQQQCESLHRSQVVRVLFWRTWTACVAGASLLPGSLSGHPPSFPFIAPLVCFRVFLFFFPSYFDVTTKWRAFPSCTTPSHPPTPPPPFNYSTQHASRFRNKWLFNQSPHRKWAVCVCVCVLFTERRVVAGESEPLLRGSSCSESGLKVLLSDL